VNELVKICVYVCVVCVCVCVLFVRVCVFVSVLAGVCGCMSE
jgi:hypothetical protein